jgi:hypothetical protein
VLKNSPIVNRHRRWRCFFRLYCRRVFGSGPLFSNSSCSDGVKELCRRCFQTLRDECLLPSGNCSRGRSCDCGRGEESESLFESADRSAQCDNVLTRKMLDDGTDGGLFSVCSRRRRWGRGNLDRRNIWRFCDARRIRIVNLVFMGATWHIGILFVSG